MKNSAPIGFLDSGIGGSTVLIKSLSVFMIILRKGMTAKKQLIS